MITTKQILLISVSVGLLAAVLVYHALAGGKTHAAPSATRVPVVVTTRPIGARTVIEASAVRTIFRPAADRPTDSITSADEVVGQVAVTALSAGKPIPREAVTPRSAALGMAFAVPDGMRAVAIALNPLVGVAGFLQPGDRVDVVATFTVDELLVARTVLQDVTLLAIGSNTCPTEGGTSTAAKKDPFTEVSNAILAVTPAQAEALILAEVGGKLRLTLRSARDQRNVTLAGARSDTLVGASPARRSMAYAEPRPVAYTSSVARPTGIPAHPRDGRPAPPAPVVPVSPPPGVSNPKREPPDVERMHSIETIRGTEKTIIQVPVDVSSHGGGTPEPVTPRSTPIADDVIGAAPDETRAVAIALDPLNGVDGVLQAGDRVDVLATEIVETLPVTRTVLQDVALLAISADACPEEEGAPTATPEHRAEDAPTAILVLTPAQAEALLLAEAGGRLQLALRATPDPGAASVADLHGDPLSSDAPPAEMASTCAPGATALSPPTAVASTQPDAGQRYDTHGSRHDGVSMARGTTVP